MIKLFRTSLQKPGDLDRKLQRESYKACETIVTHEVAFIDPTFEVVPIEGLKVDNVKEYIYYIADRRLAQFGLQPIYRIEEHSLPWLGTMLNAIKQTKFFENLTTK